MTATLAPPGTTSRRLNLAFAPDGGSATCVAVDHDEFAVEHWAFRGDGSARRAVLDVAADIGTQTLPGADGRVLVFPNATELHRLVLVDPERGETRAVGEVTALGGYLLPGLLVTYDDARTSTVWRVTDEIRPVVTVEGVLSGGLWLDPGTLAVNLAGRGIALDLSDGSHTDLFSVSEHSRDRVLLFHRDSRLLVVSTTAAGEPRLGWTILGSGEPVAFPAALHGWDAVVLDPAGRRVLLHEMRGASSRLAVYTPTEDRLRTLQTPPGVAQLSASWTGAGIRLPLSTPQQPLTVATIRPDGTPAWSLPDDPPAGADADTVVLAGPAGPIEAVVYGGADWRTAQRLVVALHGGPLASWCLGYDPLAQALVEAGYAVLAPNCRGSIGYGAEHARPLRSGWAGADLADVRHLTEALRRDRDRLGLPAPVLAGVSYGAFLALVAAAAAPRLWSAVVAIAPFLSGPRLHRAAAPWVAASIEGMGALVAIEDDLGPRDVLRLCPAIDVPLLLMHGTEDELIPVGETRALAERLVELGRPVSYQEARANHDATVRLERRELRAALLAFCRSRPDKAEKREEPW